MQAPGQKRHKRPHLTGRYIPLEHELLTPAPLPTSKQLEAHIPSNSLFKLLLACNPKSGFNPHRACLPSLPVPRSDASNTITARLPKQRGTLPLMDVAVNALAHPVFHAAVSTIRRTACPAAMIPVLQMPVAAWMRLPRSMQIWLAILAIATLLKNLSKQGKSQIQAKKLHDSGECPFPFIFFHDPIDGFKKHSGKLALCTALWAFLKRKDIVQFLALRFTAPAF